MKSMKDEVVKDLKLIKEEYEKDKKIYELPV